VLALAVKRATRLNRQRVFDISYSTYLAQFKAAASDIGLPALRPHGLRHGSATADSLGIGLSAPVPISDIALRGRWASERSARHYVQSGFALTLELDVIRSLPPHIRDWLLACEPLIVRVMRATQFGR
jgi:integrase